MTDPNLVMTLMKYATEHGKAKGCRIWINKMSDQ